MKTTAWFVVGAMALALGCGSEQPTPAAAPNEAFTPAYYNGHIAHFDEYGVPFYYDNGKPVFVDRHDPQFQKLVTYYHSNRMEYERWEDRNP